MSDRHARIGASTGIGAVILVAVGFIGVLPKPPPVSASAQEVAAYYSAGAGSIHLALAILTVGLLLYIWFLGSVRANLATAEGAPYRLSAVAYGAGIATVGFFVIGLTAAATAAFRTGSPPEVTQSLNDVFILVGGPGAAAFAAFFIAAGLLGLRTDALASPVGALLVLCGLLQLLAIGVMFTQTGPVAGDGVFGLDIPILTFMVGVLALSITFMRAPAGGGDSSG